MSVYATTLAAAIALSGRLSAIAQRFADPVPPLPTGRRSSTAGSRRFADLVGLGTIPFVISKGCAMERLKSRKLWAAIAVFASATALLATGSLNGDQWVDVVKWVGGFYLVGQGAVDAANKVVG